tara:strand:- start:167 stop:397 length:231 start_codon:yes stop_codon:yes gene_type:complete
MEIKGFEEKLNNVQTPSDVDASEKPLKSEKIKSQRVDINVLKSKLQETEAKEFKKNLTILSALIFVLGFMGIYLSL